MNIPYAHALEKNKHKFISYNCCIVKNAERYYLNYESMVDFQKKNLFMNHIFSAMPFSNVFL